MFKTMSELDSVAKNIADEISKTDAPLSLLCLKVAALIEAEDWPHCDAEYICASVLQALVQRHGKRMRWASGMAV